MFGGVDMELQTTRDEVEQVVKQLKIDRVRFFEVSKQSYMQIIKNTEDAFVDKSKRWNEDIHWANMGHYRSELNVVTEIMQEWPSWIEKLPRIIPTPNKPVYALFEDVKAYTPKYWLYEAYICELMLVLNETCHFDFYIVSKKFDWLISVNHHDVISYVGDNLEIGD